MPRTIILIISGPAGSGKTTLCEALLGYYPDQVERIVTTTTRAPREGEINGLDYHFLERETFQKRVEAGEFLEWAEIHGNLYGSQKRHLVDKLRSDVDLLLNIDVQGAATFREAAQSEPYLSERLVSIFVRPSSLSQLRDRLQGRGSENPETLARRLKTAEEEIPRAAEFDYVIESQSREDDFNRLLQFYHRAKGLE
ncbi:MAG: guanylate kinase [Verrucomicrobiota bacterium JB022]|nr:guanylate kinase [Verrucomicrobiota bacterium JB022]